MQNTISKQSTAAMQEAYLNLKENSTLLKSVASNTEGNKVEMFQTGSSLLTIVLWCHGDIMEFWTRTFTDPYIMEDRRSELISSVLPDVASHLPISEDCGNCEHMGECPIWNSQA